MSHPKITFEEAGQVRRMANLIDEIMEAAGKGQPTDILRDEYFRLRDRLIAPLTSNSINWKPPTASAPEPVATLADALGNGLGQPE